MRRFAVRNGLSASHKSLDHSTKNGAIMSSFEHKATVSINTSSLNDQGILDQKRGRPRYPSCSILTNYLLPLSQRFPSLMRDYLERDAFCFEYGRVWASPSLFSDPDCPIAMTTEEDLADWTPLDGKAVRELWSRNCEEYREKFVDASGSGVRVEAVAKFSCVHQHAVRHSSSDATVDVASRTSERRGGHHFLCTLAQQSDLPVDVFNSDSLRIFTSWVFRSVAWRFGVFAAVNGFFTALFFLHSQIFESLDRDSDLSDFKPFFVFVMCSLLGVHVVGGSTQHSRIKYVSTLQEKAWMHCCAAECLAF